MRFFKFDAGLMVLIISVSLILLIGSKRGEAGAWVQKKGGYFFKLSSNYLYSTKEFSHEGEKKNILEDYVVYDNTSFRDVSFTAYLEYGLFERFTVVANLPYKISTSQRTESSSYLTRKITTTVTGPSDLTLSGRWQLFRAPVVVAIQSGVKIPLGYDKIPENDGPALGTGEVDGETFLLFGQGFHPLPFYFTAGLGYRNRGGPLHDEYLYSAEIGYSRGPLLFKVTVDGVKNVETPPDLYGSLIVTPLPGGGGAFPTILYGDQDYTKISPGIIYKVFQDWALSLDAIHIAAGKNIISGTTFSIGIVKSGL